VARWTIARMGIAGSERMKRVLGATHVISLHLPMQGAAATPTNMFHVISRCFQILQSHGATD
jgi:hypothetical protein